jgi:hypothetical protein
MDSYIPEPDPGIIQIALGKLMAMVYYLCIAFITMMNFHHFNGHSAASST